MTELWSCCESRDGRRGLLVPNKPFVFFFRFFFFLSFFLSFIIIIKNKNCQAHLCGTFSQKPAFIHCNIPYGFCGRKAALNRTELCVRAQDLCESRGGRSGLLVPDKSYGFCGHTATLNGR